MRRLEQAGAGCGEGAQVLVAVIGEDVGLGADLDSLFKFGVALFELFDPVRGLGDICDLREPLGRCVELRPIGHHLA